MCACVLESPYRIRLLRKVGGVRSLMPFFLFLAFGDKARGFEETLFVFVKRQGNLAAPQVGTHSKHIAFSGSR